MGLGARLKGLLDAKNMTQRELALRFGWSEQAVSQYVHDLRQPDFDAVVKLAAFFGVTIDYLLGRTNNPGEILSPNLPDDWEEVIRSLTKQGISAADVESAIELIKTWKKMREG